MSDENKSKRFELNDNWSPRWLPSKMEKEQFRRHVRQTSYVLAKEIGEDLMKGFSTEQEIKTEILKILRKGR
jgi:hypothetical protein